MKIRDRIKEFRRVPAAELQPNPKNWRTHPQAQQDALKGILADVGFADALLARETPEEGLMLIDGHLRAETASDALVPVLILDITEAEAAKLLAVLDPLGAMAEADTAKLDALLREVETGSEAIQEMLSQLAQETGVVLAEGGDQEPAAIPDRFDIMVSIGCPIRWRLQCPSNGTSVCYLSSDVCPVVDQFDSDRPFGFWMEAIAAPSGVARASRTVSKPVVF